jgi:hypothetical protein
VGGGDALERGCKGRRKEEALDSDFCDLIYMWRGAWVSNTNMIRGALASPNVMTIQFLRRGCNGA